MDAKGSTPKHIIITRPEVKVKERLLKETEKKLVTGRLPGGRGSMGEEVRGLRSTDRSYRIATGM